ncbi:MAG: AIR synthase-related protein, partial [Terriglobales bacterium]
GLAVALAECALPAGVGLSVSLASQQGSLECLLFGEDAGRVVLSCDPSQLPRIQQIREEYGVFADVLGETGSDHIEISVDGESRISASVQDLLDAYEGALEKMLRAEPSIGAVD